MGWVPECCGYWEQECFPRSSGKLQLPPSLYIKGILHQPLLASADCPQLSDPIPGSLCSQACKSLPDETLRDNLGVLGFVTPCCDHSRRFPGNFHALVIVPTPFSGAVRGPEPKAAMESVGYVPPINACTTCCPAQLQQQQQGQTISQKGIQQSGVGFYTAEDRKLRQSMVFQIIHDFPAFSVTTPDFHGNPHMLWEVVLFAYVEPCSHLQG